MYFNTLGSPPDQTLKVVADAFKSYNYSVTMYQLPATVPTDDFIMKLRALQQHMDHDALLIIYISGHGDLLSVPAGSLRLTRYIAYYLFGDAEFSSNLRSDGPLLPVKDTTIWWDDIYPQILSFSCDVLTILDCCHSGAAALTPSHIAAVNATHGVNRAFAKEVIATAGSRLSLGLIQSTLSRLLWTRC